MAVWLLTGATGFVGRHVLPLLCRGPQLAANRDDTLIVLGRRCPAGWPEAAFKPVDLTDAIQTRAAIERISPDVVIHTAGRTPPAPDEELYRIQFLGDPPPHERLAIAAKKAVRIVLSGSAAELGPVSDRHLAGEREPMLAIPSTPTDAANGWLPSGGLSECVPMEVIVARVFNPIGPGTPASQALGRFASRLAEPGPDPLDLAVGDLDSRRDFIDVRDVARAMVELARRRSARPGLSRRHRPITTRGRRPRASRRS